MSKWKVYSFYYLDADNENEAWSKATLELPANTQITKLAEIKGRYTHNGL